MTAPLSGELLARIERDIPRLARNESFRGLLTEWARDLDAARREAEWWRDHAHAHGGCIARGPLSWERAVDTAGMTPTSAPRKRRCSICGQSFTGGLLHENCPDTISGIAAPPVDGQPPTREEFEALERAVADDTNLANLRREFDALRALALALADWVISDSGSVMVDAKERAIAARERAKEMGNG